MPGRTVRALSRSLEVLVIATLLACGSGSDTPSSPIKPDPPAPPPAPVPSTLTISAGDGQQGEPGTALAIVPTVVVRSASGAPIGNVAVTFAIDSGGGTIATPTAVTDATGLASPGTWRLGATEGSQVLVATVGSIAPIRIRAVSRIVPKPVGNGSISGAGGTLRVNQPGSPLDGLTITLPQGAVSASTPITLSIASTAGMSLPAGFSAASPALVIASSAGRLKQPAIVRFPVRTAANQVLFLGLRDPVSGSVTVLQPLRSDSVSVSASLPTLDASGISKNPSMLAQWFGAARADDDVQLLTLGLTDPTILSRDYDSGFRMRRDNWDFESMAIAWLPFLAGGKAAPQGGEEVLDNANGMIATSLWYFENRKSDGPLYNRFRLQPDQPKSNRVGIRWSALANVDVYDPGAQVSASHKEWLTHDPAVYANTQFKAVKAMFYLSYNRPVPVILWDVSVLDASMTALGIGVVSQTEGNALSIVVADNSEATYSARFTSEGMLPFTVLRRSGESYVVRAISPVLHRTLIDGPAVASNWPKVVAGTVGNTEGWPTPTLHHAGGTLDTASVFLADTLRHWWQCDQCPDYVGVIPALPRSATHVQAFQMARITNGAMPEPPAGIGYAYARWSADSVLSDIAPTTAGYLIYLPQPRVPEGTPVGWLDWQKVVYRKASLRPSPDTIRLVRDSTVAVTLSPSTALPAGTRYSWVLRKRGARDSVLTTTPTHTRAMIADTAAVLLISAHEPASMRVIARDSVSIKVTTAAPHWMITSIADTDDFFHAYDEISFPAMERALANPKAAMISVDSLASGTELTFRSRSTGTWENAPCCPPPNGNEDKFYLGRMPTITYAFGPFFTGWETSWTQSTTNLDAGTMSSRYVDGTQTYVSQQNGTQFGPAVAWQLVNGVRSGKTLTGTLVLHAWSVDDSGSTTRIREESYRFTFTATRLR